MSPSISNSSLALLLKAVCKTALSSVSLIISPENCFSIASFKSISLAKSTNKLIVSLLITNSLYGQDVTTLINKAANENTVSSLEQMSDDELLAD